MKKRTTIIIDQDLWRKFRIKALKEGRTVSEFVEEIIKEKMENDV
jgi:predicted CopG family antitoxin